MTSPAWSDGRRHRALFPRTSFVSLNARRVVRGVIEVSDSSAFDARGAVTHGEATRPAMTYASGCAPPMPPIPAFSSHLPRDCRRSAVDPFD